VSGIVRGSPVFATLLLAATACGNDPTTPRLAGCPSGDAVAVDLTPGAYTSIDPTSQAPCAVFPANASGIDSAEYLVVPMSATGTPGLQSGFMLEGDGGSAVLAAGAPAATVGNAPIAVRFHAFLREMERGRAYGAPSAPPITGGVRALASGPPVVGSRRGFSVCARLDCSVFQPVTAEAKVVTGNLAIYVDTAAPAGGLTQADLDSLAATFTERLYPIDTTAFGRESDIDGNTVVAVLMTPIVNQMVSAAECATMGYVTGFFYGFDLDPGAAGDSRSNHGEVFYSLVADSSGVVSCPHRASTVRRLIPVTFIHEFQHMISFNQHVLVRGAPAEALWLNEGMSHFAEELGGRSYLPDDPAGFSRFVISDVSNAYEYLRAPGSHYLVAGAGIGTLAERGAAWLFVRYLADRFAVDTTFAAVAGFTRSLLLTAQTGAQNIATHSGVPFDSLVERWGLANYVSDLPGFTAPQALRFTSWHFRSTYAALHVQDPLRFPLSFPLVPGTSNGSRFTLAGILYSGSGLYQRVIQAPAAPSFVLRFSGASGGALPVAIVPRLTVIRIR